MSEPLWQSVSSWFGSLLRPVPWLIPVEAPFAAPSPAAAASFSVVVCRGSAGEPLRRKLSIDRLKIGSKLLIEFADQVRIAG
jgi:hypothetical protein|tara:strand:+ start:101 stop:346 length:246 start_codon:yes stop_codon:yes gene_type:complete